MQGHYRCAVCGQHHPIGLSHDEALDQDREKRGWEEKEGGLRVWWSIDLGDDGDFLVEDVVAFDKDRRFAIFRGWYSFKGWELSNCEISIVANEDVETPEDILKASWDTFIVGPTSQTEITKKGDPKAIEGTFFAGQV